MIVEYEGHSIYVYDGGENHKSGAQSVCFIHGAAMDHTVWTLFSRYWAKAGYNVAAIDLPGHGISDGQPLTSISQLAEFVSGLLGELHMTDSLHLVGHSMGSLIALECAAQIGGTQSLSMLGTAFPMVVGKGLLDAAAANDHSSIDMISLFGHSFGSQLGGNPVAGIHAQNFAERLMEQASDGVMYTDLNACNLYQDGEATAAAVNCRVGLVLGELDAMTSPRTATKFLANFKDASVITIDDCGHMMMSEKPELTHHALHKIITLRGD